jgi:hypothetical protein
MLIAAIAVPIAGEYRSAGPVAELLTAQASGVTGAAAPDFRAWCELAAAGSPQVQAFVGYFPWQAFAGWLP